MWEKESAEGNLKSENYDLLKGREMELKLQSINLGWTLAKMADSSHCGISYSQVRET
jgi:hypothetical protein